MELVSSCHINVFHFNKYQRTIIILNNRRHMKYLIIPRSFNCGVLLSGEWIVAANRTICDAILISVPIPQFCFCY